MRSNVIANNWRLGELMRSGLVDLISRNRLYGLVRLAGLPVRFIMSFRDCEELEALLRRRPLMLVCVTRGLLYFSHQNLSFAHEAPEIRFTLEVFAELTPLIAAAFPAGAFGARLDGPPVGPIFRRA